MRHRRGASSIAMLLMCSVATPLLAEDKPLSGRTPTALLELGIEELMGIEVTIASRSPGPLADSPAAVTVITQEDIRRYGATFIPEALRLVPGLHVGRMDSNRWGVTIRGFNGLFANKLLVMIDGRSVYSPLFSGVYWDVQDTVLSDIDRIEVIRGPGGSVWGANAVNGVINIVTKHASTTDGGVVTVGGGTEDHSIVEARYGVKVGKESYVRVFSKGFNRDGSRAETGGEVYDEWDVLRGGFRGDFKEGRDEITVQGEVYSGDEGLEGNLPHLPPRVDVGARKETDLHGAHLLTRWTREVENGSELRVQAYYDRTARDDLIRQQIETFDLELQHRYHLLPGHALAWGGGARLIDDETEPLIGLEFRPTSQTSDIVYGFVQDEVTLISDRLTLTLGSRLGLNDYTGLELSPTARLFLKVNEAHSVWGAVSRSVRLPSRAGDDVRLVLPGPETGGVPTRLEILGNSEIDSELLIACEAGYRHKASDTLLIEVAGFYNDYSRLVTFEPGIPSVLLGERGPIAVVPLTTSDQNNAAAVGGELSFDWRISPSVRLYGGYGLVMIDSDPEESSRDLNAVNLEGENPEHITFLRSSFDLGHGLELDATLRYADSAPVLNVPSYIEGDLRLGWKVKPEVEISVVGQNLFRESRLEYASNLVATKRAEIERAVYGRVTFNF